MSLELITEIGNMNSAELDVVIDAVKRRQQSLARENTNKFKVGDTVSFKDKAGNKVVGVVTKVNRKTIIVDEKDSFKSWKVSASLLENA